MRMHTKKQKCKQKWRYLFLEMNCSLRSEHQPHFSPRQSPWWCHDRGIEAQHSLLTLSIVSFHTRLTSHWLLDDRREDKKQMKEENWKFLVKMWMWKSIDKIWEGTHTHLFLIYPKNSLVFLYLYQKDRGGSWSGSEDTMLLSFNI